MQVEPTCVTDDYSLERIELTDDHYTVEQGLIRNKFRALDDDGEVVLRGKQKMLKLKEQFPFVDSDGEEVFEVNAGGIVDVAGDYTLTDAETGEDLVILDNDYSIFQDTWKIRDADTEAKLAEINSRGALTTMARSVVPFGGWIPHKYEITDLDGEHVGNIDGQLSLRDRYEVTIDDASDVPTEPVVAAAMVIDAIQGN
ncbi:MAG: LURP-one-related/scramblase family protein [Halanaeroarchaeum sp.]